MPWMYWFAYVVLFGYGLSATLPTASRREDNMITSFSRFLIPGYVSAITTNTSSLHVSPDVKLVALNNASQQPSNYSTSFYDLSFGYNLTAVTTSGPQCNGTVYGSDLDRYSCFDAWRYIGLTSERVEWGPRRPAHSFQSGLPHRWSSGRSAFVVQMCDRSKQDQ